MSDPKLTQADRAYIEGWTRKMTEIWLERLDVMKVYHEGNLRRSVANGVINFADTYTSITFSFLEYGIYVDRGVGRGYKPGNDGKLKMRDETYRHEHGLGKPREKKPWFYRPWNASINVLKEVLKEHIFDQYSSIMDGFSGSTRKYDTTTQRVTLNIT